MTAFFFSSRRRHTRCSRDWSSDVCSSDLAAQERRDDQAVEPAHPLDILAQQIVAAVACEEWQEDGLFDLVRGAYPYRDVSRSEERRVGEECRSRGSPYH